MVSNDMVTARVKTWKILSEFQTDGGRIGLICPQCGTEASLATCGPRPAIIAIIGLRLVLDGPPPPDSYMPDEIQCRTCRRIFSSEVQEGVT